MIFLRYVLGKPFFIHALHHCVATKKTSSNSYAEKNKMTLRFLNRCVYFSRRYGNVVNKVWEKKPNRLVLLYCNSQGTGAAAFF